MTVRNEAVNAMLLHEFLKEHRKNEEQEATIAQLKRDAAEQRKQIEALTATVQKVNEKLELTKSIPQLLTDQQTPDLHRHNRCQRNHKQ
jgi:hypothetical protein